MTDVLPVQLGSLQLLREQNLQALTTQDIKVARHLTWNRLNDGGTDEGEGKPRTPRSFGADLLQRDLLQSDASSAMQLWDYTDACERMSGMVQSLDCAVTLADPLHPDCPLVAASTGFAKLTGLPRGAVLGRNCRFLQDGVPPHLLNKTAQAETRAFIDLCGQPGRQPREPAVFTQINKRANGDLFTMHYLLYYASYSGRPFILALQMDAGLLGLEADAAVASAHDHLLAKFERLRGFLSVGTRDVEPLAEPDLLKKARKDSAAKNRVSCSSIVEEQTVAVAEEKWSMSERMAKILRLASGK